MCYCGEFVRFISNAFFTFLIKEYYVGAHTLGFNNRNFINSNMIYFKGIFLIHLYYLLRVFRCHYQV